MKQIVILGGGTAGSIVSNRLYRELPKSEYQITVVDRDDHHHYQPGYLFVPFGMYRPRTVVKKRSQFFPRGVRFVMDGIKKVDPVAKTVELEHETLPYHYLIIATGCTIRPDQVPGMSDPKVWRKSVFDFYTLSGSGRLHKALKNFERGHLVVHISEMPIKCPVAPLEFVLLADWYFFMRRRRLDIDITFVTPLDGAFTKPVAKAELGDLLRKRDIEIETDFNVERIDPDNQMLVGYDGREIPFDLLVTVPPVMGQQYVADSGIGDEMNYVPADKHTMQSTEYPDIFVLGDAGNFPTSKAGAVVHFQSESFVPNFINYINGRPMTESFDGHANCFIESGFHKALLLDFNYDVQPVTGKFPFPVVGPLKLLGESRMNHLGKLAFYLMYWGFLARGLPLPFPRDMSKAGKDFRKWGFMPDGVNPLPKEKTPPPPPEPDIKIPIVRVAGSAPLVSETMAKPGDKPTNTTKGDNIPVIREINGKPIDVTDEGFMTNKEQWNDEVAEGLAKALHIELDDVAWSVIRFVRQDFEERSVSPTLGRISKAGGFDVKTLFSIFGTKPAKKLAYIAGAPKPVGCV
ncbi:TusE/DsrC/DsvC family sulfur relay protein [Mobiluncus porci]|uniref:TusE/DsrC/DsvC family sulfur relay protein n=1 Tax=Mobiluncus porci TaxID=2652278 RepID=A0A7K0K2S4_9ACTO|nr:TusE/DsrC/DsvC family sulfur relay protein [Mobiluncus porci]MST49714.1 TusE/DsrC/DsvC family sulfur relay protein [Mobiluncus porci]